MRLATVFCLVVFGLSADLGEAGTSRCSSGLAEVTAERQESVRSVCNAAHDAVEALQECGIEPKRLVRVFVVRELPDERPAHALGFFDANADKIVVAAYQTCVDITRKKERFGVPMSRPLYQSLLVHEFFHAIIEQNSNADALSRTEHEYIAYALQLALMDPALREKVLAKYPHRPSVGVKELNESYFDLSPADFAVKAYNHFRMAGNECAFIRGLIQGTRTLPSGQR